MQRDAQREAQLLVRTADAGALCVRAANAAVLRGGSESLHASRAIADALRAGLHDAGLPADAIQLVQTADQLFPKSPDLRGLKKFNFDIADSVSTKAERTEVISKIGFGQRSYVAIVTTPSGTYSSDAITSPHVLYPGIDVSPKHGGPRFHMAMSTTPRGTFSWSVISSGSFTYYNSSFAPAQ